MLLDTCGKTPDTVRQNLQCYQTLWENAGHCPAKPAMLPDALGKRRTLSGKTCNVTRRFGETPDTVRQNLQCYQTLWENAGHCPAKPAMLPDALGKRRTLSGKTCNVTRRFGETPDTVRQNLKCYQTLWENAGHCPAKPAMLPDALGKRRTLSGKTCNVTRRFGKTPDTVRQNLKCCWTLVGKCRTLSGKTCNVTRRCGKTPDTVRQNLKCGWTLWKNAGHCPAKPAMLPDAVGKHRTLSGKT